jgi:hypothetical protein
MTRRLSYLLMALGPVALAATACAPSVAGGGRDSTFLQRNYVGTPPGVTPVAITSHTGLRDDAIRVAPDEAAVVTWGSSGCPRLPVDVQTHTNSEITVMLSSGAPPNGSSCPADLAPTTSILRLPTDLDEAKPLQMTLVDGVYGGTFVLSPSPTPGA